MWEALLIATCDVQEAELSARRLRLSPLLTHRGHLEDDWLAPEIVLVAMVRSPDHWSQWKVNS